MVKSLPSSLESFKDNHDKLTSGSEGSGKLQIVKYSVADVENSKAARGAEKAEKKRAATTQSTKRSHPLKHKIQQTKSGWPPLFQRGERQN